MAETQNLTIPDVVQHSVNHLATPSRRGHRHKRSFAISGDFEFLKQPSPLQPSSDHITNDPILMHPPLPTFASSDILQMKNNTPSNPAVLNSPLLSNKISDPDYPNLLTNTTTPKKRDDLFNQASPRFFISEEPKFSSPIKGVPDAIINLDDVLKTRPRSFKSHRRTESAPAGLEIIFDSSNSLGINNNNNSSNSATTHSNNPIEEEEDIENNEQNNLLNNNITTTKTYKYRYRQNYPHSNKDAASKDGKNVPNVLMSPMKPSSPIFHPISRNTNTSPIKNNSNSETNDTYNSMRIKGQRQRYYHYTKQLNISSHTTSPLSVPASYGNNLKVKSNNTAMTTTQTLKEQSSMNSLTSNYSKTPLSPAVTPYLQQYNTPSTPISYSEHKKSSFIEPQNSTNNSTNNNNNIGNVSYRIPHKKSWTDQTRHQMSPSNSYGQQQPHQLTKGFSQSFYTRHLNNDNSTIKPANSETPSSFNFESKVYDIEYNNDANIDQDNGKSSNRPQEIILDSVNQMASTDTNETDILDKTDRFILSKDILLGEPGDAVDLSSSTGYDQSDNNNINDNSIDGTRHNTTDNNDTEMKTTTDFNNHEIEINTTTSSTSSKSVDKNTSSSDSTVDRVTQSLQSSESRVSKSGDVTKSNCDSRKFEIRSISDGIIQLNINDTANTQERRYRKKKSRLSVLINNLFK